MVNTIAQRILPGLLLTLLLALALWIYWPGVVAAPILDDLGNLNKLARLAENPEYARDYVFGNRAGLLGRSAAMATFVLEELYLSSVSHITLKLNVFLHLVNGLLVAGLLYLLFRRAGCGGATLLSLLLGGLWLLSPMQVSTVLYQVQRMAMLCASFMLLSCICYVFWREALASGRRAWLWLLATLGFALLALFSKENGIVIIPVLLLLEVLWLSSTEGDSPLGSRFGRIALGLIAVGAAAVLTGVVITWSTLQEMHRFREFSLEERLLTQARVLWDYAGQFLWPDLSRLGLYHDDFPISRSLTEPVSTSRAVFGWLGLLGAGIALCRYHWGRLLFLGPTLFLVAHGIEGSVYPLELYFEHRNYFPSLGLVLFIGTLVGLATSSWPELRAPLQAWLALMVLVFAMMTSSQVQIWSSPQLRVLHHVNGHPGSYRANADMAVLLAEVGGLEEARPYARQASEVARTLNSGDHAVFALLLNCLAGIEFDQEDIDLIGQGSTKPGSSNILLSLVRALQNNSCPDAGMDRFSDRMAQVFIEGGEGGSDRLFFALALMENSLEQYDRANAYADRFLSRTERKSTALLMKLHFLTALGDQRGVDRVVMELQRMDREGRLTSQERDNLGYYLQAADDG